jgi:hypothetical protein
VKPGLRAFRARRGRLLRYRVAVTNTSGTTFRLAGTSCPIYIEQLTGLPAQAYVLNCRPVGAIAPRGRVLFEMRLRVPAHAPLGARGLTWELAPRTYLAPFASAAVWIDAK